MSVLSRLLRYASREERTGAQLEDRNPWFVPPTEDGAAMLRALSTLFPDGGFVYFEDPIDATFKSWLQENAVPAPLKIAYGTIWPRPDCFHVPLEPSRLEAAATLVNNHGIALPSVHLHVHDGTKVLLEWHDAFTDQPMRVVSSIPSEAVEAFGSRLRVG